jgi:hypothetical protein
MTLPCYTNSGGGDDMEKRDWFDEAFVAERKAQKEAVVAKEARGEQRKENAKKAVFGFVQGVFKKVAVA